MSKLVFLFLISFTISLPLQLSYKDVYQTNPISFPSKNGLLLLTSYTIDEAIQKIPRLAIIFYAPWCPHCRNMMPELEKASKHPEIQKMGLVFGRIDLDYYKELAERFNIQGFPTVYYYVNGKNSSYEGGRNKMQIVEYFYKKFINVTHNIHSMNDLYNFLDLAKSNKIVYFGDDNKKIKEFQNFAKEDNNLMFGLCTNKKIIENVKILEGKSDIAVIYKKFDDPNYEMTTNITKESLTQLRDLNREPLLKADFQSAIIESLQLQLPTLIFLYQQNLGDKSEKLLQDFKDMAKKFRSKLYFTFEDRDVDLSQRVLNISDITLNDIKGNDNPVIIIFDYYKGFNKWIFNKFFNIYSIDNFSQFIQNYLDRKYKPPIRSEKIPEQQNGPIYKLVHDSFNSTVLQSSTFFIIKFFVPSCKHCQRFAPIFINAANKYSTIPNLKFAEFDLSLNDFDFFDINSYPRVYLFKGEKYEEFHGNRTEEEIGKFIEENMKKMNS